MPPEQRSGSPRHYPRSASRSRGVCVTRTPQVCSVAMSEPAALVNDLVENIVEQYPVHRGFLDQAIAGGTPEELARLGTYLEFCLGKGLDLDYLAECYLTILGDTLEEQLYFRDHKNYRHSTFDEVAASVY